MISLGLSTYDEELVGFALTFCNYSRNSRLSCEQQFIPLINSLAYHCQVASDDLIVDHHTQDGH